MKKEGYYSSGQFAQKAHVTKKTLRYYDEHRYLTPSYINENGARFYTDQDFQRIQQIQLFKYLGFSLDDIKEMTMRDVDEASLTRSLKLQLGLLEERIAQMNVVKEILQDTTELVAKKEEVDWSKLVQAISITGMENSLKQQYKNASNISARIALHRLYTANKQGWFPWVYEQCQLKKGQTILELGCGNGSLWLENIKRVPPEVEVYLTDQSEGMLRDLKKNMKSDGRFSYEVVDFHEIPFENESMDMVIANHVLFYARDMKKVLKEIQRVLKPGGKLICGTYGSKHMIEISRLVEEFDDRIVLAAEHLYEIFGKENGGEILTPYFEKVTWAEYEDHLMVTEPDPLVDYVISCHGNQNQYIVDNYKEFRQFVDKKVSKGFYITKEAGVFIATKS